MPKSSRDQITLEKTPNYSFEKGVERLIYRMDPNIKLIFMVCNPIKRLISDYVHNKLSHKNKYPSFKKLVFTKDEKVDASYKPVKESLYVKALRRFYAYFHKSQILILDGDAFITDPVPQLNRVERFLGLQPVITNEDFIFDKEKGFFCRRENGKSKCMPNYKGRPHPKVQLKYLKVLQEFYKPYNEKFYSLAGTRFNWTESF